MFPNRADLARGAFLGIFLRFGVGLARGRYPLLQEIQRHLCIEVGLLRRVELELALFDFGQDLDLHFLAVGNLAEHAPLELANRGLFLDLGNEVSVGFEGFLGGLGGLVVRFGLSVAVLVIVAVERLQRGGHTLEVSRLRDEAFLALAGVVNHDVLQLLFAVGGRLNRFVLFEGPG